jgi:hypothetical protein
MSSLRAALNTLAEHFTSGGLQAIRTANLQDLLSESGAPRRSPGRPRGPSAPKRAKGGRLGRRTPEQIAEVLAKVVSALRATRGKGLRSEQIRAQLGLDVREMPRVLHEGIKAKKLRSKGQKRSTTYFVR